MIKSQNKILIVDDEVYICEILSYLMQKEGLETLMVNDGENALQSIRLERPDIVLLDIKLPGIDGLEVYKQAKELDPDLPIIFITGYADLPGAVEAMRQGAHDYLAKPFEHNEVIRTVRRALSERELKKKLNCLTEHVEKNFSLGKMMGPSQQITDLIIAVHRVAQSEFSVIILGETGSGKELVARAIHQISHRSGDPFVAVDCGAIPESLLESELFGYEKGAFTGAVSKKTGKFEEADKGTLFLDEICNMPLSSQAKLLRALQEKKICRIGGRHPVEIDIRLLVASNQDLEESIISGDFREDLYYRINEFMLQIPPLRERKEDIFYLANRFLEYTNMELGKTISGFGQAAMKELMQYEWPGNVRQLRSTVRRAVLLADRWISVDELDIHDEHKEMAPVKNMEISEKPWQGGSLKELIWQQKVSTEKRVIEQTLKYTGGNKAKAARLLDIDYKTMHNKVKQLGISVKESDER